MKCFTKIKTTLISTTIMLSVTGGVMAATIKSGKVTLRADTVPGTEFFVRLPTGNVSIEENGQLQVDYYFEYNGEDVDVERAKQFFSTCQVRLSPKQLSAECPRPTGDDWVNAFYRISLPEDYSASVDMVAGRLMIGAIKLHGLEAKLESGRAEVAGGKIAGLFDLTVSNGRIVLADLKVDGRTEVSVHSGRTEVVNSIFKSGGNIRVQNGRIDYRYDPTVEGSITYRAKKVNVVSSGNYSNDGHSLYFGHDIPSTHLAVERGRIVVEPK